MDEETHDTLTIGINGTGGFVSADPNNNQFSISASAGLGSLFYSTSPYYTSPNTTTPYYTSPNYTFDAPNNNNIEIHGDNADILINGKSLKTFIEGVENRLAILQPDPKKLEKYEALRKAYDHYKILEKLVGED